MNASVPITSLQLNVPIHPGGLKYLRGAVIEKVMQHQDHFKEQGIPTDLFHNHFGVKPMPASGIIQQNSIQRYPVIQYKVRHRQAELWGIGPGAKALQLWLPLAGPNISMQNRSFPLVVNNYEQNPWTPAIQPDLHYFRLNKWLPFNSENYRLWQQTPRLVDRVPILDKILWGNFFHLAESLEVTFPREKLQLFVSTIDQQTYKTSYRIKKLALDITFATNLNLPEEIGLGQGVSLGFGKVQRISRKVNHLKDV